ncbi:hypothetical protein DOT_5693 [Desulfosporosinus sp. OT]|nr:hypothetical protein DOT_5693 [Desulfosporosinus sp. OT]
MALNSLYPRPAPREMRNLYASPDSLIFFMIFGLGSLVHIASITSWTAAWASLPFRWRKRYLSWSLTSSITFCCLAIDCYLLSARRLLTSSRAICLASSRVMGSIGLLSAPISASFSRNPSRTRSDNITSSKLRYLMARLISLSRFPSLALINCMSLMCAPPVSRVGIACVSLVSQITCSNLYGD